MVPPVAPPGTIALPAYPGTAPSRFASASELVSYGTWRLDQLSARERGLLLLGRPPNYLPQRIGGFALLGGGAALAVGCAAALLLLSVEPTDESDTPRGRALGFVALGGIGVLLGGAVWLHHLKRDNPYFGEIRDLRRERREWLVEVKRARRQAKIAARTSFDLTRLQVRF
jgi:hypothetical protein